MLYVLCYPRLAPADSAAIEAFRRKHEPARAEMVRAHVTLVFGVTSVSPEALIKIAEPIASATPRFDFAIDGATVAAHEQGPHNLFLEIGRGREGLIALNRALYVGALAAERADIEFDPHITVATNADLRAIFEAAPEAKPLLQIEGRIDTLDLAALNGVVLTPVASLPLAG